MAKEEKFMNKPLKKNSTLKHGVFDNNDTGIDSEKSKIKYPRVKTELMFYLTKKDKEFICSYKKLAKRKYNKINPIENFHDLKHNPRIEFVENFVIFNIGISLHINKDTNIIENLIIQDGSKFLNFNIKEDSIKGFPPVVIFPQEDLPEGDLKVFIYCRQHGLFLSEFKAVRRIRQQICAVIEEVDELFEVSFPDLPKLCVRKNTRELAKKEAIDAARQFLKERPYSCFSFTPFEQAKLQYKKVFKFFVD